MNDLLDRLVPVPSKARITGKPRRWKDLRQVDQKSSDLGPEEYRVVVKGRVIRAEASCERGFFLAGQTIKQLKLLSPASCPELFIEDAPALAVRGYMLDISRCKVPVMDQLFRLVDLLALLKFNQLQLYTEHTFAYSRHPVVWQDASPITGEEVAELRDYCAKRFIELVPNQNAFGHMERWLRHDAYRDLAESPDGFHHPVTGWRPSGSVIFPGESSLKFIDGLLDELLPWFDSSWVHLGCDEPWELGQGRSADRAEKVGRHVIFREYVTALHGLLSRHGKRMLFWSDELRSDPRRIEEFPSDIIPVVWGYEEDHPFDEECGVYASLDRSFLIAPGDSSWNSFTGRLDNAFRNIKRAATSAIANDSLGLILTSWGDNGHQQVWPTSLPAMLVFSAAAWNPDKLDLLSVSSSLNALVFRDDTSSLGKFWDALARIDSLIPVKIKPINSSFPFDALYQPAQEVKRSLGGESVDCLFKALSQLADCRKQLDRARPSCPDGQWLVAESSLAWDMTFAGLKRAESIFKDKLSILDPVDCERLVHDFEEVWQYRNREGGLKESLARICHPQETAW